MRGDLVQLRLARVQPPLPGEGHHADQHLRVHRRKLRIEAPGLELGAQDVLDLTCDIAEQAAERAGARRGVRIPDQDAEAVATLLDVLEQRQRRTLEFLFL